MYVGATLETRLQLCGTVVALIEGERVEGRLPARQGRLIFVYLAANRLRSVDRDELAEVLWPAGAPAAWETALNALISKLRGVLGHDRLVGRAALRMVLPWGAWVDLEVVTEALHRAETEVALGEWARAWGPARVALNIARRSFLHGEDAPWVAERRQRLEEAEVRALECVARVGLGLGGPELASVKRSGRDLVRLAPYRESGYRLLMEALAAEGNVAEATTLYSSLCARLRDDLGIAPAADIRELHRRLIAF